MKKALARTGTFTNSNGDEFTITGIQPMLFSAMRVALENEWEKIGRELPTIPAYTTEADEIIDWDEASVLLDGTPEEIQAWKDYENTWQEFEGEYNVRRMKVAFLRIQDDPMEDQEWVDEMEVSGVPIPEENKDLKLLYGETKVIASVGIIGDLTRLLVEIQALSGMIDQEVVEALRKSFRLDMERRSLDGADGNDTGSRQLDIFETISPGGDGSLLGDEA